MCAGEPEGTVVQCIDRASNEDRTVPCGGAAEAPHAGEAAVQKLDARGVGALALLQPKGKNFLGSSQSYCEGV